MSMAFDKLVRDAADLADLLASCRTQNGASLAELASRSPVLLVFLRHTGCTFCREALSDLSAARERLERKGIRIVLVHLGSQNAALEAVARYGLGDVDRIGDPERRLYAAFGLKRGGWRQLAGWKALWRGVQAGLFAGHGLGRPRGDVRQMPGIFFLNRGAVALSWRHRTAADRPDYERFADAGLAV